MTLLTPLEITQTHRELYAAILNSYLPHGNKKAFAKKVGITIQWLSNICQAGEIILPDLETAKNMARHLPAPNDVREAFVHHVAAARDAYAQAKVNVQFYQWADQEIAVAIQDVINAHNKALYESQTPIDVQRNLAIAMEAGCLLGHSLNIQAVPLQYLRLCLPLAQTYYSLDKVIYGLYWSKLGKAIAANLNVYEIEPKKRDKFEQYRFATIRNEASGYHNLKLAKDALVIYAEAENYLPQGNQAEYSADLKRNKLLTIPLQSRFPIGDAMGLADGAKEHFGATNSYLNSLMTDEALARAYISHGGSRNFKRALKIVEDFNKRVNAIVDATALHRVILYKTEAALYWKKSEVEEWRTSIRKAIQLAKDAGLHNQQRKIFEDYAGAEEFIDSLPDT